MKNLKKILALVLSFAMILTMMQMSFLTSAEETTENVATVYVSTEGSDDTGDGTQGNPYASLSKAMEAIEADADATAGKIIITEDGESGIAFTSAAHSKMITIEGIDDSITINGNKSDDWKKTQGPLTIQNISVTNLGLEPFGYELNVEESVNLITRLNVRAGYNSTNGDKIYMNAYKHSSYSADVYLYIGKGTVNGDLDIYVDNIYSNSMDIQAATYNGNVNVTVNNYTKSSNGGYDLYIKNSGVDIKGAFQVILNNGVTTSYWADFRKTQAQNGTWLMSGEVADDGSILETTDTVGIFKVKGGMTANAYPVAADGSVSETGVASVRGVLDLSAAPGEYKVTYTETVVEAVDSSTLYVSTEGSDQFGNGSEEDPFASLAKAMEALEANANITEGKIIVTEDGEEGIEFTSAVHTKMITIEGIDDTIIINGTKNDTWRKTNGPLTLQKISVTNLGLEPFGNELNINDSVNLIKRLNVRAGYNTTSDDKIYLDAYKHESSSADVYLYIGSGTANGDIDIYVNNIYAHAIDLKAATYNGNVNITVNNYKKSSNDGDELWVKDSGVNISGALQVILNNGVNTKHWANFRKTQAQGGTWLISGDVAEDGSIIETTDETGVFKVKGGMTANAYPVAADGSVSETGIESEKGILDLSNAPGEYQVRYTETIVEAVNSPILYVSAEGSDETGDGTEENPFASLAVAMAALEANANITEGKIILLGDENTVIAFTDAAHTKMITIEGINDAITIAGTSNSEFKALQGPLTLKNLSVDNLAIETTGYEFKIPDDTVTLKKRFNIVANCNANGGSKVYLDAYKHSAYNHDVYLYIGRNRDVMNGDLDIYIDNIYAKGVDINRGTFNGNVNVTVNKYTASSDSGDDLYIRTTDITLNGALQVILNNGITSKNWAGFRSSSAQGGKWLMSGEVAADGSILETTDEVGVFKVKGEMTAVAYSVAADGSVSATGVASKDGVLDLSDAPGEYQVRYTETIVEPVDNSVAYVSAEGSDETGDGTEGNPFASLATAMAALEANTNITEGKIILLGDENTVIAFTDAAHTKMITIEGINDAITIAGTSNSENIALQGPLTLKNLSVDNLAIETTGYEFKIPDDTVTLKKRFNIVANCNANGGSKVYLDAYKHSAYNHDVYLYIGRNRDVMNGDLDIYINNIYAKGVDINRGTFNGNVNVTVNKYTASSESGDDLYIRTTDITLNGALQVILNNGITSKNWAGFRSSSAQGGKWLISGESSLDGSILETTDEVGVFKVKGGMTAVARKVDSATGNIVGDNIIAENGVLDLSEAPGEYKVSYIDPTAMLDAIYVSETGDDNNVGSEEYPVASFKVAVQKAKSLLGEKVIYVMGTVPTLVNGREDYVTYSDMITVKGYDKDSTIELTSAYVNHLSYVYSFQGPTTLEDIKIVVPDKVLTNGNEVRINNCFTNAMFTVYIGDLEKSSASAKVNKLIVDNFQFLDANFENKHHSYGLEIYYGAFGGSSFDAAANYATGGVELYLNDTNIKSLRLDKGRGYIAGDVKITVDGVYFTDGGEGYGTWIGNTRDGEFVQVPINGSVMIALNNNVSDLFVTSKGEITQDSLGMISAAKGVYFVYSADVNGNKVVPSDEPGKFDIISKYSVDVKDAEGNVAKRAKNTFTLNASGSYYVGYFNAADINGDGKLDIRDLVALKNEFANNVINNYPQFDISADGVVGAEDLTLLQKYFLGLYEIDFTPVEDDLAFTYFEDVELESDDEAAAYKATIYGSDDSNVPQNVTTYYVSSLKENSTNEGTIDNPFTSIEALNSAFANKIKDNDRTQKAVLFERGSVFRTAETIILDSYTYYGAYGTGDKPQILGSLRDYADPSIWTTENGGSIWKLQMTGLKGTQGADNIVITKNGVEGVAVRRSALEKVTNTGDYYYDIETKTVYLYCDFINPGFYFDSIEIATTENQFANYLESESHSNRKYNTNFTVENLTLKYASSNTFDLCYVHNSTIRFCELGWVGGDLINSSTSERYGNAIRYWNEASNMYATNNHIYQVYDAPLSFQGANGNVYTNLYFTDNLIETSSFGFEFWAGVEDLDSWDKARTKIENIYFERNINRLAAGGMGTVTRDPKYYKYQSFIQPFQMDANDIGTFSNVFIRENIFDTSYASFYYCSVEDTINHITFDGNKFWQTGPAPCFANGVACETLEAFEEAVRSVDKDAEVNWIN